MNFFTDYVTSFFQIGAVLFLLINIHSLFKDREVKGVSMWMMAYFTIWSYWRVWMWWDFNQIYSMWTGLGISIAYTIWLVIALKLKVK